jgi:hypothetical protein
MATLGFEEYVEPLKIYLQKYREVIDGLPLLCCRSGSSVFTLMFLYIFLMVFLCVLCISSSGDGLVIADGGM